MNQKATRLASGLFIVYCGCMLWLLFARVPNPAGMPYGVYLRSHITLRPLGTIRLFSRLLVPPVRQHLVRIAIRNLLGNVLLFIPLGYFLPRLFPSIRRLWRTVLSVVLIISTIELLQALLMVGACDIDDLILNTLGATLGYGIYKAGSCIK